MMAQSSDSGLRFMKAALTSTSYGVVILDVQGRQVFANSAGRKLMRVLSPPKSSAARQRRKVGLCYLDGRPVPQEETLPALAARGQAVSDLLLVACRPGGADTYVSCSADPIRDHRGQIIGTICILRDVTLHHREDEARRIDQERLEFLVAHSPDFIFFQDRQLRFVWMTGPTPPIPMPFTPEQALGKTDAELFNREDAEWMLKIKRRVMETGVPEHIAFPLTFGEYTRHYDVVYEPWRDRQGQIVGITGYARDITALQEARVTLETIAQQRTALAEITHRALTGIDLSTLMNEAVNAVAQTLGVEYCGILELLPQGDAFVVRASVGWKNAVPGQTKIPAARESQAGYTMLVDQPVIIEDLPRETRFRPAPALVEERVVSGVSLVIPGRKQSFGVLGVHTRQPRTFSQEEVRFLYFMTTVVAAAVRRAGVEEELRSANQVLANYARIVENGPDLVSVIDRQYIYRTVNRTYHRMHGLPAGRIVGHSIEEIHGKEDFQNAIRPRLDRCFGGESVIYETWFTYPKAGRRCMEVRYFPLFRNRQVEYVASVTRDITDRKQAEQFREEYISFISHDLQNPLTALLGQSDWLRRVLLTKGLERETHAAESVLKSARRLNSMVQDLVDSVRLEAGVMEMHVEPVDLIHLATDISERVGTLEDRARLHVDVPEWVPPVLADRDRVERAIVNLLTNALKYSKPDTPVILQVVYHNGQAAVSVIDQGVGIPPEEMPLLFEKFYRARTGKTAAGMGLGLYISRLIVEALGGRIWAESEVGKGSTFSFTIPPA